MKYTTHNAKQGSEEWKDNRALTNNASEASIAAGINPYKSRESLLRAIALGIEGDVNPFKQKRFDDGHRFEDLARPIAEEVIRESLYPEVCSVEIPGLSRRLGVSYDGKTMDDSTNWEHKTLSDELAASLDQGIIPEYHQWQMEQGMLINGAERCLFTASKWSEDNELLVIRHVWYVSNPEIRAKIIPTWKQFEADLTNYVPETPAPVVIAAPISELPALDVKIRGDVLASNLPQWKGVVTQRIESINTNLQSDQDFADAEAITKFLDDGEKKIDLVKAQAQAQATDIDELFRALDEIRETMREKRLKLQNLIKNRKEAIRIEIANAGIAELAAHIASLNKRLGANLMPKIPADFAGAIKGKRTIDSLKNAVATTLANAKVEASAIADRIQANLKYLDENAAEYRTLFADLSNICTKEPDDFAAAVKSRVADHKDALAKAEAKRKADAYRAEQERIDRERQQSMQSYSTPAPAQVVAISTATHVPAQPAVTQAASAPAATETDPAWKIAELVSGMDAVERLRVLQFCERVIEQRQAAAA